MIELQILAALSRLDRARERIRADRAQSLGSPQTLAALSGLAVGWLARGLMLRSGR